MIKDRKIQINNIEVFGAGGITFFFTLGVFLQFVFYRKCINCCLGEYSNTILTIHTSITLIPITILAIVGSIFNKKYLGIGYVEFALQLKPKLFKQKRVFIALISVLFMNVILLLTRQNILLTCLLLVSFVIVLVSVWLLLDSIINEQEVNEDIREYIIGNIKSKKAKDIEFVVDRVLNYIDSSEKNLEKCRNDISDILNELLECRTRQNEDLIDFLIEGIINTVITIDEEFGLQLVTKYYDKIDKDDAIDFFFDNDCNREVVSALKKIDIDKESNIAIIKELTEVMLNIQSALMSSSEKEDEEKHHPSFSTSIAFYGNLIGKRLSSGKKVVKPDNWEWIVNSVFAEENDLFLSLSVGILFAMIRGKQLDFVQQLLFDDIDNKIIINKDAYLLYISAHCYCMYLAYYENESLVKKDDKNQFDSFLNSEIIKETIKHIKDEIMDFIDDNNWEYLDKMMNYSLTTLHHFRERYSNGIVHTYYPEKVVEQYILFFITLDKSYNFEKPLNHLLKNESAYYYLTYIQDWDNNKDKYLIFCSSYDWHNTDESIKALHDGINRIYVKESLFRNQSTIDKKAFLQRVEKAICQQIKEEYSPLLVEKNNGKRVKIELLTLNTLWKRVEGYEDGITNLVEDNFSLNLIEHLLENNMLMKNSQYSSSVRDIKNGLERMDNKYLLGSKILLEDSMLDRMISEKLDGAKLLGNDVGVNCAIVDGSKIRIKINDITATNTFNIDNSRFIENDNGECNYSFAANMPVRINKKTLKKFLKEEQLMLKVVADITVETRDDKVGVYIEYNDSNK